MIRNVVYSNIANMDLVAIHDYIAEHNRAAAFKVLMRIREACRSLGSMPFTGSACDELQANLRFRVVGKYVIYYRVTNDIVWIQRVLHGSQDAQRLL